MQATYIVHNRPYHDKNGKIQFKDFTFTVFGEAAEEVASVAKKQKCPEYGITVLDILF
jgi:hypothetical protein